MKLKKHAALASIGEIWESEDEKFYLLVKDTFHPYAKIGGVIELDELTQFIAHCADYEEDTVLLAIYSLVYQNFSIKSIDTDATSLKINHLRHILATRDLANYRHELLENS